MELPVEREYLIDTDPYSHLIRRVFRIDSVEWGESQKKYIARFRGHLLTEDSEEAYDQLAESLVPLDVTPLFRKDGDDHVIILTKGVQKPTKSSLWKPAVFFFLTVISVVVSMYFFSGSWIDAVLFAATLMSILLAHEFGHYLVSRFHKTAATLPYFIPFPLASPFGTMGAVIVQKEAHRNRKILLDIGMAGPLAGFVVALPLLLLGLALSNLEPFTMPPPGMMSSLEGNSLLYLASKFLIFGKLLPEPTSFGGLSPAMYWVVYFFTGKPLPINGTDVILHPIAYAAWAGLLITALNLIPAGQLDGGHIINSLFGGKRASLFLPVVLVGLILLGFVWTGWFLWAALIFFLGRVYAEPLDQITQLDPPRKLLALFCLLLFVVLFTPVPLQFITP